MGDHTAFFYGTLMAPPVLYRVIYGTSDPDPWQRALTTVRPALLLSHRRHKVRHADYPAVVPYKSGTSSVRGTLVTGLMDEDIRRLDIFEGSQYTRSRVSVKVLKSAKLGLHDPVDEAHLDEYIEGEQEAETYIWSDPLSDLEDDEWDFEEFRKEKMWAWVGATSKDGVVVDEGFEDVDRDVREREAEAKDPTGGRGANGTITRELEAERTKEAVA